jgi:hypothetical protein
LVYSMDLFEKLDKKIHNWEGGVLLEYIGNDAADFVRKIRFFIGW